MKHEIDAVLNMDRVRQHVTDGRIRATRHAQLPLTLYDYTNKAQFDGNWDHETRTCRGLVVADDGRVIARPFAKFFNLSEHAEGGKAGPAPALGTPFTAYEKLDGSLIVLSNFDGLLVVNTRGSFESDQAKWAAEQCRNVAPPPPGVTWCAEACGLWNTIVIRYSEDALVFLAALDNATGRDIPSPSGWPWRHAERYNADTVESLCKQARDDGQFEGWVLRFECGMRVKVKLPEYLRLHKLITGCSNVSIWECLSSGTGIGEMLDRVPDEFMAYVKETAGVMQAQHAAVCQSAREAVVQARPLLTRKEQAEVIKTLTPHTSVAFTMLDGRDHNEPAWKAVRPKFSRPFLKDTDTAVLAAKGGA